MTTLTSTSVNEQIQSTAADLAHNVNTFIGLLNDALKGRKFVVLDERYNGQPHGRSADKFTGKELIVEYIFWNHDQFLVMPKQEWKGSYRQLCSLPINKVRFI